MLTVWITLMVLVGVVMLIIATLYTVGVIRLSRARSAAHTTLPHKGEIWLQDYKPLYIKDTAKHGVMIAFEIDGKLETSWDSWEEWRERLRARVVIKTPQTFVR